MVEKKIFHYRAELREFWELHGFFEKIRNEVRNALKIIQSPKKVQDFIWKSISSIIEEIPISQCRSIMVEEEISAEDLDGYLGPDTG